MIYNAYQDTDIGLGGISVVSAGHIFAKQGRKIYRPKGREDYLLFYVAKGSEFMLLDCEVEMKEGSFVIFRPFERQIHIQKSAKISEFYFIHFNAPKDFNLFGLNSFFAYSDEPSSRITDMFEQIINELQSKEPFYEQICAAKLFNIILLLKRRHEKNLAGGSRHSDKISFIIQNMNKEYMKSYSLEDYAKMCCMSKYHFLRVFKDITGISPIEYRNSIRLSHAKDLLRDTDSAIGEIGLSVGYASNSYFCNAFKSRFNMLPAEYRKKFK